MAVNNIFSTMRISGMYSGLDTESIVKSLISVERLKVDRVSRQKQLLEWKKDAHRDVNNLIKSFRETTMSVLSPDTNLFSEAAFSTTTVTYAAPTNAVSITVSGSALLGSRTIDRIDQLASSTRVGGQAGLTGGTGVSTASTLANLAPSLGIVFGGEASDTLSFDINGVSFRFAAEDTLDTVMKTIQNSEAGVSLVYTELSDRFLLTTKATGADTSITVTNGEGNLFGEASAIGIGDGLHQNGMDASLVIDGVSVSRAANTFTIDGATYTLKTTSASAIAFSVTRDVEPATARIKSFVKLYNDLVGKLQDTLGEEVFPAYPPLTDEQRAEMSESEIATWETKAKSGMLRKDRDLNGLLTQMRGMLFDKVRGTGLSLSDVGIKTGFYYDGGKITLDEGKLKKALETDPDAVMRLFTQTTTESSGGTGVEKGMFPRLIEAFSSYTSRFNVTKTDQDIEKLGTRITELNEWLSEREEEIWKRFTAMEKALSTMQSQSDWLAGQFQQFNQ